MEEGRYNNATIFISLCLVFLLFSAAIYTRPMQIKNYDKEKTSIAAEGRLIWQKYNCHVCHQLYGLGGYLGPDLTNVYKKHKGNDEVLRQLFKGGMKQMPVFKLSNKEMDLLVAFLKTTNESGSADPRDFKKLSNGMIEQNGKQE